MLELRLHVPDAATDALASRLDGMPGVAHVVTIPQPAPRPSVVFAEVDGRVVDALLLELASGRPPITDVTLIRHRTIAVATGPEPGEDLIWADLIAEARSSSRPAPRFLALMAVAGILAAIGVMQSNVILIVGAMAISPDLLPIVGTCVGIVGRRPRLIRRGLGSLGLGLGVTVLAAVAVTIVLRAVGLLGNAFTLDPAFLGTLLSVNLATVIIASAAGVAGMLAFETRASAAVGVAISVTTIPAAAYLGVAIGPSTARERPSRSRCSR